MIRGVLFDVDDTLVDHTTAARTAIRSHLRANGLPADDDAVAAWSAAEERHFARHLLGELTFQEQRRARVREVVRTELDDAAADAWFAGYTERFEAEWRCFDDVLTALARLAYRGLAVGVVTNVNVGHQRRKLAKVGLGERFDVLVGLDTLGVAKPHPAVFRHACELLGTTPAETAFVGDRLDHDALGARDAGLPAVWLDRCGDGAAPVPEGVLRVTSLAMLEEALAEVHA